MYSIRWSTVSSSKLVEITPLSCWSAVTLENTSKTTKNSFTAAPVVSVLY